MFKKQCQLILKYIYSYMNSINYKNPFIEILCIIQNV